MINPIAVRSTVIGIVRVSPGAMTPWIVFDGLNATELTPVLNMASNSAWVVIGSPKNTWSWR